MIVRKSSREVDREEVETSGKRDPLVVGLDIGTTKICAVVAK